MIVETFEVDVIFIFNVDFQPEAEFDRERIVINTHKRDGLLTKTTPPPACIRIFPVNPQLVSSYKDYDFATSSVFFVSTAPTIPGEMCAFRDQWLDYVFFYVADHPPDLFIGVFHEGGVDFHLMGEVPFLFLAE